MADPVQKTITLEAVDEKPWQQPGTNTFYWNVVPKGFNSEPVRYVQNKDKGAEPPQANVAFLANVYPNEKGSGYIIYPIKPKAAGYKGKGQGADQAAIKAIWAIKQSLIVWVDHSAPGIPVVDMAAIERHAGELYHMVDRVKTSTLEPSTLAKPGYSKFKQHGERLNNQQAAPDDRDIMDMYGAASDDPRSAVSQPHTFKDN